MAYASGGDIKSADYNALAHIAEVPVTDSPPLVVSANMSYSNGTLTSTATAGGWDRGAYSTNGYLDYSYVSAKASQTTCYMMMGLNTDPAADNSYASIDYAWYFIADGTLNIYENGAQILTATTCGSYTTATVLSIVAGPGFVNYYKDGVVIRSIARGATTLYFDSSFYPSGSMNSINFRTFSDSIFAASEGVNVFGRSIYKNSGTPGAWSGQAYSITKYTNSAYCSAKANAVMDAMFGLNSDPYTDSNYASLDYAWYFAGDSNAYIYESGANPVNAGAYTTSTTLSIRFDGTNVIYYKDGAVIRTVARAIGLPLYFDSSFNGAGSRLNSVVFSSGNGIGDQWGVGYATQGLGQSTSSIATVAGGANVTATAWTGLIQTINACLSHQGQTSITPSSVTAGNIVTYYNSIVTGSALAANKSGTTGLALTAGTAQTQTFATAWGSGTPSRGLQMIQYFTFASYDAMRYFFNAGGTISVTRSRVGGSATTRNTDWTNLCAATGIITLGHSNTTKVGGSGTPLVIANNNNGGVWSCQAINWTQQFLQYDSAAGYTADYIQVYALVSNNVVGLLTYFINSYTNALQDTVDGTMTSSAVVNSPATTYLTNTWGTPTYSSSAQTV